VAGANVMMKVLVFFSPILGEKIGAIKNML
jgi:hypothetical protein